MKNIIMNILKILTILSVIIIGCIDFIYISNKKEVLNMEHEEEKDYICYVLTREQAKVICKYWDEDIEQLRDDQICELIDKTIEELKEDIIEEE